jgi:hypothetical protein
MKEFITSQTDSGIGSQFINSLDGKEVNEGRNRQGSIKRSIEKEFHGSSVLYSRMGRRITLKPI